MSIIINDINYELPLYTLIGWFNCLGMSARGSTRRSQCVGIACVLQDPGLGIFRKVYKIKNEKLENAASVRTSRVSQIDSKDELENAVSIQKN